MELEGRASGEPTAPGEGCLVVAVRLPVRIIVLVLVVPIRMVWDLVASAGRFVGRTLLLPFGRGLAWLGRMLFALPAVFLWQRALKPLAGALATGCVWLARALFVRPWVGLWRYVVAPTGRALARLGHVLIVVPAMWLHARVLTPMGHFLAWSGGHLATGAALLCRGLGTCLSYLAKVLFVWPWVGLWRYVVVPTGRALAWLGLMLIVHPVMWLYARVLTPMGHGCRWLGKAALAVVGAVLYWTLRILVVLPALFLWRWILVPLGRALAVVAREVGDALGHAWRAAGRVSRAVGRFLALVLRWTFVEPARRVYRTVLTPVGHLVRDGIWRPAARAARSAGRAARQAATSAVDSARQARAEVRRMLFGGPGPARKPIATAEPRRELPDGGPRTLEKRSESVPSPSVRGW
ncbi:hypothetical protein DY218_10670 [Streptomyces triticagri]|uniref:Uncharacterized protein n=1 Tax=Streptomyces triticagri TaxID=2293568 RepID=A0A372M724_9ACTN|nr:hypothetical protein [Streptomyces triticagri]RFU86742.1 hypothetical protein DY218_10670 [Streptomyces triticagri]